MNESENIKKGKVNIRLFLFIPLAVIIIGLFIYMQWTGPSVNHDGAGRIAPNFRLPDLEGRYVSLEEYRGKVVIVNIWATWCPPCVAEAPSLNKLNSMLNADDFKLLAVSIDDLGERAVKPFMAKHSLDFPVLVDPDKEIMKLYGVSAVPESFIIKRDGTIDGKITGAIDWTDSKVVEYFRSLIKEK